MAIKLFEHPLSPYARKVKIVLYEKGIDFERVFVNPMAAPNDPDQRTWADASPRREVPTLVDGDVKVFDSTIILDYVEERFPDPPAMPSSPAERARIRMLGLEWMMKSGGADIVLKGLENGTIRFAAEHR
jgi:glutathione S-transferase/RNA polymerase-associated protein